MAIKSNKKPLLDEPAANEDTDFSAELIKQINKEAGNKIAFNLGTDEVQAQSSWTTLSLTDVMVVLQKDVLQKFKVHLAPVNLTLLMRLLSQLKK